MRIQYLSALVAAVLIVSDAAAQSSVITTASSGHTYFHRAGASAEQHFTDLATCQAIVNPPSAAASNSYGYVPYTGPSMPAAAAGAGLFLVAAVAADAVIVARRTRAANVENCMVVRGWQVVRVSEDLGEELEDLEQEALRTRLAAMIGAESPEGEVVRRFENEARLANVVLFENPESGRSVSLSVRALPESDAAAGKPATDGAALEAAESAEERTPEAPEPSSQSVPEASNLTAIDKPLEADAAPDVEASPESVAALSEAIVGEKPLEGAVSWGPVAPRDIAAIGTDATLLVIHVGGPLGGSNPPGILLERVSDDGGGSMFFDATAPRRMFAAGGRRLVEQTLVLNAPPGRWRVAGLHQGMHQVSFCFGAPSFEVAAGEVVYAGAFYTSMRDRGPDMAMERAQAALADAPALAQRVRPAAYQNGETTECRGSYLYAYEVEGAPMREGYVHGSAAFMPAAAANQPATDPTHAVDASVTP